MLVLAKVDCLDNLGCGRMVSLCRVFDLAILTLLLNPNLPVGVDLQEGFAAARLSVRRARQIGALRIRRRELRVHRHAFRAVAPILGLVTASRQAEC